VYIYRHMPQDDNH